MAGEAVRNGVLGDEMDQATFDRYLSGRIGDFGRNTCFALPLAFSNAMAVSAGAERLDGLKPPRICFKVLNDGLHVLERRSQEAAGWLQALRGNVLGMTRAR